MARKISVEIVGDARSLEKAFSKSSRAAKGFQGDMQATSRKGRSAFGGLGKAVGFAAGAIGTAGLIGVTKAAFQEMADAQKVSAQTAAVLRSTGKAANVSAKQIEDLSESLMQMSGVDDEAIASGENLLLTFTNVRNEVGKGNDVFNQATRAMLDMSVALGQDMKSSAIQLGKALNDPIKGVTALRRVGVSFTAAQKSQIKTLVATGHTLQAQKIILAELNREFGGSARAAGQTLPGKLNILRESLLNLAGTIAAKLAPSITRIIDQMVSWLNKSQNQKRVLDTVNQIAAAVATTVDVLSGAFKTLNAITGSTKNTLLLLTAAFVAFKALKMIGYVATLAKTFRGLAAAEAAAAAAGAGGGLGGRGGGRFGRAVGAVGAVAVGAPLVAAGLRKIPGWDKTFRGLGGAIAGATVARGGMHVEHQENHFHGVQNPRQMEQELTKRAKGRPHRRRGAR